MANEVSKGGAQVPQRSGDVFSVMRDEFDRMFERFERGWPGPLMRGVATATMVPDLDVHDDGKQLTIEADLPGLDDKDVSVTFANGVLSIKGERKFEREEKKTGYVMSERSYGSFERSLRLPDEIDDSRLEAHFEKGVLKIVAPRKPDSIKSERRIEINKT